MSNMNMPKKVKCKKKKLRCINCDNDAKKFGIPFSLNRTCKKSSPPVKASEVCEKIYNYQVGTLADPNLFLCTRCYNLCGMIVRHQQLVDQSLAEFNNLTRSKHGEPPIPTPKEIVARLKWSEPPIPTPEENLQPEEKLDHDHTYIMVTPTSDLPEEEGIDEKPAVAALEKEAQDQPKQRKTFKRLAMGHLSKMRYGAMVRTLMDKSVIAKDEICHQVAKEIKHEIRAVKRDGKECKSLITIDNMFDDINWHEILTELEEIAPTTMTVLKATITPMYKSDRFVEHSKDHMGPLVPGLGALSMIILYLRYPKIIKKFQQVNSGLLYRACSIGSSHKITKLFNRLGLSLGADGTRALINRVKKVAASKGKEDLEPGPDLMDTTKKSDQEKLPEDNEEDELEFCMEDEEEASSDEEDSSDEDEEENSDNDDDMQTEELTME